MTASCRGGARGASRPAATTRPAELLYAPPRRTTTPTRAPRTRARLLTRLAPRPHRELRGLPRRRAARREVVGVLAGFPLRDGDGLARRFVSLSFARCRRGAGRGRAAPARRRAAPPPPLDLVRRRAGGAEARRQGVATALLSEAERRRAARRLGRRARHRARQPRRRRSTTATGSSPRGRPAPTRAPRARSAGPGSSLLQGAAPVLLDDALERLGHARDLTLADASGKNGSASERAATASATGAARRGGARSARGRRT